MEKYIVTGMSCAACQNRVEKAVSAVDGVQECTVSLLTNSMTVEGNANSNEIIKAVSNAGYSARLMGEDADKQINSVTDEIAESLASNEIITLKRRLLSSVIFLLLLMYLSMGHMMFNWPVFPFLENHVVMGVMEMLLAAIIMLINNKFFTSGFSSLMAGYPNMDTLVALGSSASFIYSVVVLFLMINAQAAGNEEMVMMYGHDLYFESAAMIPCLITVGKLLEAVSKGKTTNAVKDLIKLTPKTALLEEDGEQIIKDISEVKAGDIVIVKAGENIPVDGIVIEGNSAVDESMLTGESKLQEKKYIFNKEVKLFKGTVCYE